MTFDYYIILADYAHRTMNDAGWNPSTESKIKGDMVYIVNNWKEITKSLMKKTPFTEEAKKILKNNDLAYNWVLANQPQN